MYVATSFDFMFSVVVQILALHTFTFSLCAVWADNADYCAKQYTGTGALKTDFTR